MEKQTILQIDISLATYAPQTMSVFGLINVEIVWGDPWCHDGSIGKKINSIMVLTENCKYKLANINLKF